MVRFKTDQKSTEKIENFLGTHLKGENFLKCAVKYDE